MRGKVIETSAPNGYVRITPAYAGKRYCKSEMISSVRDHPRLCGEKAISSVCAVTSVGSPPPMRGKAKNSGKRF